MTRRKRSPKRAPDDQPPARLPAGRWWAGERARFAIAFALVAGCLLTAYYFPRGNEDAVERWTAGYLQGYTRLLSYVLAPFDPRVTAHGNVVSGRFSMQIVKSCDAMEANILFVAAVLAVPAAWARKAAALVAGLAGLVVLNVVRLFVLYWTGVFAASTFEFFHYDVWPLLMIAFATADFVLCARWVRAAGASSLPVLQAGPDAAR